VPDRAFLLLSLVMVFAGCRRSPDQEQIIRWLDQAVADCEQGRSREVAARLASSFRLDGKPIHPLQASRLIGHAFSYVQGKRFYYPRPQVNISEDGAVVEVSFPFLLAGGGGGAGRESKDASEWLLDIADKTQLMRVGLQLEREGEGWLVKEARLERFDGLNFRPLKFHTDF
jgi:hypothetical protein